MELDATKVESKYVIFALMFVLSNQLQVIGDAFFEEVSTKQWFVLLVLQIMEGYSPTLGELSEAVGSSHQNVKQLVLKLEQKGFVELYKDEKDARILRIKSTEKALEFSKTYHEKSQHFMNELFQGIDEADLMVTKKVMIQLQDKLVELKKRYV